MIQHRVVSALALAGVVTVCAPAVAEEQGVIRARLDLNRVESSLKRYQVVDVRTANKLIEQVNRAAGFLKACKNKQDPAWQTEAKRAQALDKAIRAKVQQKTPPAKTPPAKTPPAKTPPAKTPPAKTPPAKTPPAKTPAAGTGTFGRWNAVALQGAVRKERVFPRKFGASSTYGRGYMPDEAGGPPNVFPRFGDSKGAWAPKSKTSNADYLKLTFPPTEASHVLVYETDNPGAIRKVVVDGKAVFEGAASGGSFREAQVFYVRLDPPRAVSVVEVHVQPSAVKGWPEIDCVALVPAGDVAPKQADPKPAGPLDGPLSKDDRYYYDRAIAALNRLIPRLNKHRGTVFTGTDRSKPAAFEVELQQTRYELGKVKMQQNPAVLEVRKKVEEITAKVEGMKAESQKELDALGADYPQRFEEAYAWMKKNRDEVVTRFPDHKWSPYQVQKWAEGLRPKFETMAEKTAFVERVQLWDPRMRVPGRYSADLRNKVKNALQFGYRAASHRTSAPAGHVKSAEKTLEEAKDLSSLTKKELREEIRVAGGSSLGGKLFSALGSMRRVMAWHKGLTGEVPQEIQALYDGLRDRNKVVRAKVQAQLESERLAAREPGHEKLIAIARKHFKDALAIAVSEGVKTLEGTWSSKDLISETTEGNYIKKTYRVKNQPYKYDRFWVQVARPREGHPDQVEVYDYGIRKFEYGAKPVGEWYPYIDQRSFFMLKKNLPK